MNQSNTQLILLYATPSLSPKAEKALFMDLGVARKDVADLDAVPDKKLHEYSQLWAARNRVRKVKSQIVAANLPIVVKIAQRMNCPGISREQFVSDGLLKLLECINAFDVTRGFKFSTYLYRPLYRHFHRMMQKEARRNTGRVDDVVMRSEVAGDGPEETTDITDALRDNKAELTDLEMFLVLHHYGIEGRKSKTLKELHIFMIDNFVGKKKSVGRLQQILAGAIQKLRDVLIEEVTDEIG